MAPMGMKPDQTIVLTGSLLAMKMKTRKAKKGHLDQIVILKMRVLANLVTGVAVVADANEIKMNTGRGIRSNAKGFLTSETKDTDFSGLEDRYLLTMMFM